MIFISYSHKDRRWMEALRVHLGPVAEDEGLDLWADTRIRAGDRWREEIEAALKAAKVAVLLISPDFLASPFITKQEVPPLLKSAVAAGVRLLCVYVRPSLVSQRAYRYHDAETGGERTLRLTEFQGLNTPDEPLSKPRAMRASRRS